MSEQSKLYQIARRYVDAVYDLLNTKERETFSEECRTFTEAHGQHRHLSDFLRNPLIEASAKQAVLRKVFPRSTAITNISNLFGVLCEKHREMVLPAFCEIFEEKVYREGGRAICEITLARPAGPAIVKAIQDKIKTKVKKELILRTKIDPSILGGFYAEVDGHVVDASLRSELSNMKSSILSSLKR